MLYAITVVVFIHIWVYHHVLKALYRSNNPTVFPFHRIYPGYPIYFRKRKLCHIFFEIIKKAVVYLRPFTSVQIDNRYIPSLFRITSILTEIKSRIPASNSRVFTAPKINLYALRFFSFSSLSSVSQIYSLRHPVSFT